MGKYKKNKEFKIEILFLVIGFLFLIGAVLEFSGEVSYMEKIIKSAYEKMLESIVIFKWLFLTMGLVLVVLSILSIREKK